MKEKMFSFWINCAFFSENGVEKIDKFMLDKAWKDKKHEKI